jgi:hypothetical protein
MVVAAKDAELQRLGVELRQAQELLLAAEEAEAERTDRSVRDLQARVDELQARADGTSRTCCASCNMVPAAGGGGGDAGGRCNQPLPSNASRTVAGNAAVRNAIRTTGRARLNSGWRGA